MRVPQVRATGEPYRSSLMSPLDGNSDVLDHLATEMCARGLSTRDAEDAFRDATGELLISKSAVSEITDRLWEDYGAFVARDLSEVSVEYLLRRHLRVARPPGRQGGPPRRPVDRLRRPQAPLASRRRQQGVRGRLD